MNSINSNLDLFPNALKITTPNEINITLKMQMPVNEKEAINQSFKKLDGPPLLAELVGRDFSGEYFGGFKYILSFREDGMSDIKTYLF